MNQNQTLMIMIAIASVVILVGCTASMLQRGEEWQAERDREELENMQGPTVSTSCSGGGCSGGSTTGGCTSSGCALPSDYYDE